MNDSLKAQRHIDRGEYICAYESILTGLDKSRGDSDLLAVSRQLSSVLRSKCIGLASNKATDVSLMAKELEPLLRAVNRLSGDGVYG